MRFPPSERVIYEQNPLIEVICQLRFPKILRIETQPPSEFQEAVRNDYPRLNVVQSLDLAVPAGGQADPASVSLSRGQSYEFLSKSGDWKLVLSSDFLALSTPNYQRWEEFRSRLESAVEHAMTYSPSLFTRIGLRYQDIIVRSKLGLLSRPWSQLLKLPIAGVLASEELPMDDFSEVLSIFSCQLSGVNAVVRVRHGLARQNVQEEVGYLIDADFFSETPTEVENAFGILDSFNQEAGHLFRWCITEELHTALGPRPIEE